MMANEFYPGNVFELARKTPRFDVVYDKDRNQLFIGEPTETKDWLKKNPHTDQNWRVRTGAEMNSYSVHDYLMM